jgi:5-bromo-4-chloroindolyl phosphate hydrolysis protein
MEKKRDSKNRWRSKTVAFRMSPEEAEQLNAFVKLSGLTKQEYLIRRVLTKDILVNGNPRVYKALRNQLESVLAELRRLERVSAQNDELLDIIHFIAEIVNGLKG